jgi:hypothetical protein
MHPTRYTFVDHVYVYYLIFTARFGLLNLDDLRAALEWHF